MSGRHRPATPLGSYVYYVARLKAPMQGSTVQFASHSVDGVIGAACHPTAGAHMRIEQLEYLAAVTQHGSLRRASERLHISQPALSEALSKLERELGVTLLDRRRSGARISRRGRSCCRRWWRCSRRSTGCGWPPATRACRCGCCGSARSTPVRRRCSCPPCTRFRSRHPGTLVEMVNTRPREIHRGTGRGRPRPGPGQRAARRRRTPRPAVAPSCCTAGRWCAAAPTTGSRS